MDPVREVMEEGKSPKGGTTWGSSSSAVLAGSHRVKPRIGRNHQAEVLPYRLDLEHPPILTEEEAEADHMEALYANGLPFLPLMHITLHLPSTKNEDHSEATTSADKIVEVRDGEVKFRGKKRKRRGSGWARMGKIPKKNAMDMARKGGGRILSMAGETSDVGNDRVMVYAPGDQPEEWSDQETAALVLGLHLFGKELNAVRRFVGSKGMKDVMHYYYGQFYKTPRFMRWSAIKNSQSRRTCRGARIVSGWRQQELLCKMNASISDLAHQEQLQAAAEAFNAGDMGLEDFVLKLKAMAGLELLLQCVWAGSQKVDLAAVQVDQCASRTDSLPAGKDFSTLSTEGILKFLVGDFRISKMKAKELFWEAVWPRLLAQNWHSEEIGSHSSLGPKNTLLFFHSEAHFVNEADLEKGVHYFDSVSEVLDLVASNPCLLDLPDIDGLDLTSNQECKGDVDILQGNHITNPMAECAENIGNKELLRPTPASTSSSCEPFESAVNGTFTREGEEPECQPQDSPNYQEGDCSTVVQVYGIDQHGDTQVCGTTLQGDAHSNGARSFLDIQKGVSGDHSVVVDAVTVKIAGNEELVVFPSRFESGETNDFLDESQVLKAPVTLGQNMDAEDLGIEQDNYTLDLVEKDMKFVDICTTLETIQVGLADELPIFQLSATSTSFDLERGGQGEDIEQDSHKSDELNPTLDKVEPCGDRCGKHPFSLSNNQDQDQDVSNGGNSKLVVSVEGLIQSAGDSTLSEVDGYVSMSGLVVSKTNHAIQDSEISARCHHHDGDADVAGGSVSGALNRHLKNRINFETSPSYVPSLLQLSALGKSGLVSTVVFLQGKSNRNSHSWLATNFQSKVDRPSSLWLSPQLEAPVSQVEEGMLCRVKSLCTYKRRRSVWSVVQKRRGEPRNGVLMSLPPHRSTFEDTNQMDSLFPVKRARAIYTPCRSSQLPQRPLHTDILHQLLRTVEFDCSSSQSEEVADGRGVDSIITPKRAQLIEIPYTTETPQLAKMQHLNPELMQDGPIGNLDAGNLDLEVEIKPVTFCSGEVVELDRNSQGTQLVGCYAGEGADSGSSLLTDESNLLELSMTARNANGWHYCQNDPFFAVYEDPVSTLPAKKRPIKPLATKGWEKPDKDGADTLALAFQSFQTFAKTYTRSPKLGKTGTVWATTKPSIPKIPSVKQCTVVEAVPFEVEKSVVKEEDAVSSVESNTKGNSGIKRKRSARVQRRAGWRILIGMEGSEAIEDDLFFESTPSQVEWKYPIRSCREAASNLQDSARCRHLTAMWDGQSSPRRPCLSRSFCKAVCSGLCAAVRQHQPRVSRSSPAWKVEPSQYGKQIGEETVIFPRKQRYGVWFAPFQRSVEASMKATGKPRTPMRQRQQGSVC